MIVTKRTFLAIIFLIRFILETSRNDLYEVQKISTPTILNKAEVCNPVSEVELTIA